MPLPFAPNPALGLLWADPVTAPPATPQAGSDRKDVHMPSESVPSNPTDAVIRQILTNMKSVAVVGLSAREDRASHGVARFLVGRGLKILGVNPQLNEKVLGVDVYPSLTELPLAVDVVDVFRRSEAVPEIVEQALTLGAAAIWLQEGVVHEEAAARARTAGVEVIQDRCLYKEWLRLMNG